jgi:hypothetical protein
MSKCVICAKWFVSDDKRVPHGAGHAHSRHFDNMQSLTTLPAENPNHQWHCGFCAQRNLANTQRCNSCGAAKNMSIRHANIGSERQRWNCQVCTFEGIHWDSTHCEICSQPRGTPALEITQHGDNNQMILTPAAAPPPPPVIAQEDSKSDGHDDHTCIICFVNPRSHLFVPCFHLVSCADCIQNFRCGNLCPVCRTQIIEMKQVYFA